MKEKRIIQGLLATAVSAIFASGAIAQMSEVETNHPIQSAQKITSVGSDGCATINGVIGVLSGGPVADADFYSFIGKTGDVISVDIDGGVGGARNVDAWIGIFAPGPTFTREFFNNDRPLREPKDPGSTHHFDPRIDKFTLNVDGVWTVAVSSSPRSIGNGGVYESTTLNPLSNGDYTLIVCGIRPQTKQIKIDVKPGSSFARVNPKAKGAVPVALLGSSDFDPFKIDVQSLRFGSRGTEASLLRCNNNGQDVNNDGYLDRLCHFDNQIADFDEDEDAGVVTGNLNRENGGTPFEGTGLLKVVPVKQPE